MIQSFRGHPSSLLQALFSGITAAVTHNWQFGEMIQNVRQQESGEGRKKRIKVSDRQVNKV